MIPIKASAGSTRKTVSSFEFRVSSSKVPTRNAKLEARNSQLTLPAYRPVGPNLWRPKALLSVAALLVALWLLAWGVARMLIVSAPLAHADAIVVLSGA